MPWTEWKIMDQREQFVRDYLSGDYPKGALCAAYGISRPTGDKWLARAPAVCLRSLGAGARGVHPDRGGHVGRPLQLSSAGHLG